MTYKALYRKYRPLVFDDVIGQDSIVKTLKTEIVSGRFSHAYLFTGSRGTGKTTCAKILAKAVNCQSPRNGDPCLTCEICKGIEEETILDIIEIDAASNNGVDNIRQIRDEATFMPVKCRYRVYIIDETHMLSTGAFNALLKIMEEPPEHVIFILATTEVHKVPATILSRCQRFDFRRISADTIAERLLQIAQAENIHLEEQAAKLIGHLADGAMRDALSLLDKCVSVGEDITAEQVKELVGLVDKSYLFTLAEKVLDKDIAGLLTEVDELYAQSKDLSLLCEDLIAFFRDILIIKSAGNYSQLLGCDDETLGRYEALAAKLTAAQVLFYIDTISESYNRLSRVSSVKTELELCLITLCSENLAKSNEALLSRITKLENQLAGLQSGAVRLPPPTSGKPEAGTALPQKEAAVEKAPIPAPQADDELIPPPVEADEEASDAAGVFPQWPEVLLKLTEINPALHGALIGSNAYEQGDLMLIDTQNEMFFKLIRSSSMAKKTLREALQFVTGKVYRLGPYKKSKTETNDDTPKTDGLETLRQMAMDAGIPVDET